jgi:hypothetical protein
METDFLWKQRDQNRGIMCALRSRLGTYRKKNSEQLYGTMIARSATNKKISRTRAQKGKQSRDRDAKLSPKDAYSVSDQQNVVLVSR